MPTDVKELREMLKSLYGANDKECEWMIKNITQSRGK